MKLLRYLIASALIVISLFSANKAFATVGVGVGTGNIVVNEKLMPGQIYQLPSITVLNTGDEESKYQVSISYHEGQTEIRPSEDWFTFTPSEFTLKPGETQVVNVKLSIPLKSVPGSYFAYIQASPVSSDNSGNAQVTIAAASKLSFEIAPANFFVGIYYRIISLWNIYQPWTSRGAILLGAIILIVVFKKYFHIELNHKKEEK